MKYYETTAFLTLRRQWYARLAADGFRDIEVGEFADPDTKRMAGTADLEVVDGCSARAAAALKDEMIWGGLTAGHRRFWALLVMGLEVEPAGLMIHRTRGGRGRVKSHRWHREILVRVERAGR